MYIQISGWHTFLFWALISLTVFRSRRGILGFGGTGRGGGALVPLCLQPVCGFVAVPFWQGRQQFVWFSWTIAWCFSITAFTMLCPENEMPRFFSPRTSARGFFITCCVSSIPARKNPSLAILAIFQARRLLHCSSCTCHPCSAIVSDMLKTYKKSVAASQLRFGDYLNHIWLRSLRWGLWRLFRPFLGTFISKFVCEIPRTDNMAMFGFVDCANKCLGLPRRFPVTSSNKWVT